MDDKWKTNCIMSLWGIENLQEIAAKLNTNVYSILKIAMQCGLQGTSTPNVTRRWTVEEDKFLQENASLLNTTQAANLLYRSRHAIYQRVRYLQLEQMLNKK